MLNRKIIGAALVAALALGASGAALATPINVGGVTIDPDETINPIIQATNFRESAVSGEGDTLTGYGIVTNLQDTTEVPPEDFCPGCSLTFTFTYDVANANGDQIVFDNGRIDFYVIPNVDGAPGFNVNDPSSAQGTTPWLSLTGHTFAADGFSTVGQLYATIFNGTILSPGPGSTGFGYLDVFGGMASAYFDTNGEFDGSDLFLNSSFSTVPENVICQGGTCYPIAGQAGLTGNLMLPVAVPEPAEIGLLGLGLGVLGFLLRRRRKEEAEDLS